MKNLSKGVVVLSFDNMSIKNKYVFSVSIS